MTGEHRRTWGKDNSVTVRNANGMAAAIRAAIGETLLNEVHACGWNECIDVKSGPLNAVFFHIDSTGKHPYIDSHSIDYQAVLKSSVFAARRARANTAIIILTNETTPIPIAGVQVVRLPVRPDQLMYSRMRAYRAVSKKLTSPTLFLDTDVHLARDFSPVFSGQFDVGLTYRPDYPPMPYNEGVILGKPGPGLDLFWNQALNTYDVLADLPEVKAMYPVDLRMWRGGQLALGALFNWSRPEVGEMEHVNRGVRYKLLPCDLYNYPVQPGDRRKALEHKWALHYKGVSKQHL